MSVNFDSVAEVIATLADPDVLQRRLDALRNAIVAAEHKTAAADALAEKYAGAAKLRDEGAAALVRARDHEAALADRERNLVPRENTLHERAKQLDRREEAVAVRERQVEQRKANLDEIVSVATR
jgi:hypothetical protein